MEYPLELSANTETSKPGHPYEICSTSTHKKVHLSFEDPCGRGSKNLIKEQKQTTDVNPAQTNWSTWKSMQFSPTVQIAWPSKSALFSGPKTTVTAPNKVPPSEQSAGTSWKQWETPNDYEICQNRGVKSGIGWEDRPCKMNVTPSLEYVRRIAFVMHVWLWYLRQGWNPSQIVMTDIFHKAGNDFHRGLEIGLKYTAKISVKMGALFRCPCSK